MSPNSELPCIPSSFEAHFFIIFNTFPGNSFFCLLAGVGGVSFGQWGNLIGIERKTTSKHLVDSASHQCMLLFKSLLSLILKENANQYTEAVTLATIRPKDEIIWTPWEGPHRGHRWPWGAKAVPSEICKLGYRNHARKIPKLNFSPLSYSYAQWVKGFVLLFQTQNDKLTFWDSRPNSALLAEPLQHSKVLRHCPLKSKAASFPLEHMEMTKRYLTAARNTSCEAYGPTSNKLMNTMGSS